MQSCGRRVKNLSAGNPRQIKQNLIAQNCEPTMKIPGGHCPRPIRRIPIGTHQPPRVMNPGVRTVAVT